MSWRQPENRIASARNTAAERVTTEDTGDTEQQTCTRTGLILSVLRVPRGRELLLVGNGRDLPRIQGFEEAARRFELELRILRLDAQEETVAARQREARHVEHRVIRLRQPVQRQHAEHARERREEDRALEGHRDEGGPAVERLAPDVQR